MVNGWLNGGIGHNSMSASQHPRDDYTPEKCQVNQQGPVWFLADQLGGQRREKLSIT